MCLKINWSVKTPLQRTGMGVARSGVWASGSGQFVYHHSGNKHGVNRPTYKKRVKSPKYAFGNSRCFSKYLKNVWIADRIDRNIKPLFMRKIVNKNAKFRQLLAFTIDIHSTIHLTYAAKKNIKFIAPIKKMVSILITSFSILRDDDDNETDFSSNVWYLLESWWNHFLRKSVIFLDFLLGEACLLIFLFTGLLWLSSSEP